jgi:X-Pro dipeptidyl-peptidase
MGDRYEGHGTPQGDYSKFVDAWMAHYLMGVDNGIQNSPSIISEGADYSGGTDKYLSSPSDFKTKDVALTLMEMPLTGPEDYGWKMMPGKPQSNPMSSPASWPSANANTESHSLHHARNDHDWFWFESPMLKNDTRIFGQPTVKLRVKTDRTWITLTPTVVDINMDCHEYLANQHLVKPECMEPGPGGGTPRPLYSVTRGWLDSRYRDGLDKQKDMDLIKGGDLTIVEHPTDYTFKKGHAIGLMVSTEINEWSFPKPYACASADCPTVTIDWQSGKSQLILPIVHAPKNPMDLFDMGMHMH